MEMEIEIEMGKILKLFLPIVFLLFYMMASFVIYYDVDEEVFRIKDSVQIVLGNVLFIGILLLYARYFCSVRIGELLETRLYWKKILIILITIPGIQFLVNRCIMLLLSGTHYAGTAEIRELGEMKAFLFDALFAVLIAPVMEELFFRFCLISSYHSIKGKVYGMLFGSVLFGIMHSTLYVRLGAMITGFALGTIYLLTEDLLMCILIHAGINLLVTLCASVSFFVQDAAIISFVSSKIYVNNLILFISMSVSLIGVVWLLRRN